MSDASGHLPSPRLNLHNSPVTLRQMRAFVAVAQDGSITQAVCT